MASDGHILSCSIKFDRKKALDELKNQGYTVIPNVLSQETCDKHVDHYKTWLQQFMDKERFWHCGNSLIQYYRIAHFQPTWEVRLEVKDVFAQIWGTEKLLSSADAVAISRPSEEDNDYGQYADGRDWLHLDQGSQKIGLHAYQGGVYLEETSDTDHCFRVLTKSHQFHEEFFKAHPKAAESTRDHEFYELNEREKKWYYEQGCKLTNVPVPKGGMVLWDSRTVHDNRKPEEGRPNKDRWRFVVFVSMTPAIWARPEDVSEKLKAYGNLLITSHWSSQGVAAFRERVIFKDIEVINCLPDIAKTKKARLLFGVTPYDFSDDKPNGPDEPAWRKHETEKKV